MRQLNYVEKHINHGGLQASAVRYYFSGELLVSQALGYSAHFFDPLTANEQRDDDGIDDAEEDAEGWQGNPRRKLWKSTCARAALNVRYSTIFAPTC